MTASDIITNTIYNSLVDELGKDTANNWAEATVRTYKEGV